MLITVIIPCYRSQKTIGAVVDEVRAEFKKHPDCEYRLVLVNDGSPDGTFAEIERICSGDPAVVGVDLSRNFGQASAKMAGLAYSEGDVTVFMDDDGQHPADGIFKLADKVMEGYDVVYAAFPKKKHKFFKRLSSELHHKVSVWAGNAPAGVTGSSFVAYSSFAVKALAEYKSPFVSLGGYLNRVTSRFANVQMQHRERLSGKSGYTFKKLIALWMNTVTNFSIVPLRITSAFGFICSALGFLLGIIVIIRKLVNSHVAAGYSSTIAAILFIGGIIMLMLGLLGEYVGRIYMTVSSAPQFAVRKVINAEEANGEGERQRLN